MLSRGSTRRRGPILYIALITALIVVLLILTGSGVLRVPFLDSVASFIVTPVQRLASGVSVSVTDWLTDMFYRDDLETEYMKLTEQLNDLRLKTAQLDEAKKEIERLTTLLGYAESLTEFEFKHARVVAVTPGNWFSTFTIGLGSSDGIRKNMIVITADGLVGRVDEVRGTSSLVVSIIDGRSSVAGLIERTRDNGMVRGNVYLSTEDDLCRMTYLPIGADIVPGDVVRTSGLDGIFPKGLVIGTVREVSRGGGAERYVTVQPGADFRHMENVLVITAPYTDEEPESGDE